MIGRTSLPTRSCAPVARRARDHGPRGAGAGTGAGRWAPPVLRWGVRARRWGGRARRPGPGRLRDRRAPSSAAGMAGLAAARELRRLGASVTVLEARDRIGGRIQTTVSCAACLWRRGPSSSTASTRPPGPTWPRRASPRGRARTPSGPCSTSGRGRGGCRSSWRTPGSGRPSRSCGGWPRSGAVARQQTTPPMPGVRQPAATSPRRVHRACRVPRQGSHDGRDGPHRAPARQLDQIGMLGLVEDGVRSWRPAGTGGSPTATTASSSTSAGACPSSTVSSSRRSPGVRTGSGYGQGTAGAHGAGGRLHAAGGNAPGWRDRLHARPARLEARGPRGDGHGPGVEALAAIRGALLAGWLDTLACGVGPVTLYWPVFRGVRGVDGSADRRPS